MKLKILLILLVIMVVVLFVGCICITIYYRKREHKLLNHIQNMLDDAIKGTFQDKYLDETKMSAIENSMWRYLCDNQISYMNIAGEKAQIQTLISDISHQTITPIANIMLYSQLLEESYASEVCAHNQEAAEVAAEIDAIREQTEKLDFLVQSLVKLSRMETGIIKVNTQQQSIAPVLEAVEKQFLSKASQKEIQLSIETSDERAVFDLKWTMEAIYNIVDNAIKYTEFGGKVSVAVIPYPLFLRIDITDNGIGISETEQANIFTRFYRSVKVSEKPGVGIGLYLAREIVKVQNGYIKLTSKLGEGSVFSVFLLRGEMSQKRDISETGL